MIPWPVALLCALFAVFASASAATMWQRASGQLHGSVVWSGVWCALSATLVVGLALLKPWARRLTIGASVLMMLCALGVAVTSVLQPKAEPVRSVLATAVASVQLLIIRYVTRPHVKAWFT